ncbi:hypothetical protein D5018_08785 [Parashewanella curva]|uniref:Ricin B lectin domain-containing protein n=1 Tax=Parashewanella curva TaxID=2338552 RepID=A0A3L8PXS6_9GAMM|nr:RICIN domain-containing protein [Parashewanella curva]RLV60104.1 hypothetical protein D5018_08785 [Parashewanella curva]
MFNRSIKKISFSIALVFSAPLIVQAEEISYFKHFTNLQQYLIDSHSHALSASRVPMKSSITNPLWARHDTSRSITVDVNSIKWYGIIRTTHLSEDGVNRAFEEGLANLEKFKDLQFQIKMKTQGFAKGRDNTKLPQLTNIREFIGKPKVTYLKNWVINANGYQIQTEQPEDTHIGPNVTVTNKPVRLYFFEFSVNIPNTRISSNALFTTVNPILESDLIEGAKTDWLYIIPDIEVGNARYIERELVDSSSEQKPLAPALVNNNGRFFGFKASGQQEYSAAIGLFDDVLEDTPTMTQVSTLEQYNDINTLRSEKSSLEEQRSTLIVEKQNLQTELTQEQVQKNLQIGKVNELTIQNSRLSQDKTALSQEKASLTATNSQLKAQINSLIRQSDYGFSLKDHSGLCMDVSNGQFHNSNNVQLYSCNNTVAQRWKYDKHTGQIRNIVGNKCLDTQNNHSNNASIVIYDCVSLSSPYIKHQQFDFVGNTIRVRANPNVAIHTNGSQNHSNVSLYRYHGGANQRWEKF